ncbi:Aste57867_25004 [Aphanomyces stellatus]|uniref:Aste57867_25004 protein n=1 Tax=Aphanomyces stellatus TaxID=120398 RepID=A0A485LRY7_9STRA|nr:hypothetical protein As57867_024926 [Aphanomyces stellatus]VFU01635.1 Aste57867_25004 [Aphanomyces stellatus]
MPAVLDAHTAATSVLLSSDTLGLITRFQVGAPYDLRPFKKFIYDHYINRGVNPRHSSVCPNFLMTRDYDFLWLQIKAFEAIFLPWLTEHGVTALPRLFRLDSRLHEVTMHYAIGHEHMAVFDYLHTTNNLHTFLPTTAIAAWTGSLQIIRYLHERSAGEFIPAIMNWAARRGMLHIVRFLHDHRTEGCTDQALDLASWEGHFETVKFLHTHRTEGCTTMAMDQAATFGHLDVVQFLHEHRTEGCSKHALDNAASRGHLEVVKFLHTHRSEGCTTKAMDSAACAGHLDVVRFLHTYRTEGCTPRALEAAAECKRYDVALYLFEHVFPPGHHVSMLTHMGLDEARRHRAAAERAAREALLPPDQRTSMVPKYNAAGVDINPHTNGVLWAPISWAQRRLSTLFEVPRVS